MARSASDFKRLPKVAPTFCRKPASKLGVRLVTLQRLNLGVTG